MTSFNFGRVRVRSRINARFVVRQFDVRVNGFAFFALVLIAALLVLGFLESGWDDEHEHGQE